MVGGGSELSDQLLDPDVPTLASQDKLKVSPKGLPFVMYDKCLLQTIVSNLPMQASARNSTR